ncbi:MAG: glycosyltransferase family 39 protein [Oscillospiraceae bacterium]|jgi:hypothetical protein|nr:glycosyltransferase family 39 protein [Oscillospiraceae bacterium]
MTVFGRLTTALFWLVTLCCFCAFHTGLRRRMSPLAPLRRAEALLANPPSWLLALGLGLAVLYGLFLRLYQFPALPGGVNQDGAMAALDAAALVQYGTDRLGTPWPAHLEAWGKGQMSALLSYILAGMFKLFGQSRLTFRLPQMVISLAALAVGWDFARRTLGKRYGWLALVLLLINPWHVMQSRWTIDCALFPHLFLFGAYCLLRGFDRQGWYYGAAFFFALAMYSYGIALYTVPFFLVAVMAALLAQRRIRWYNALGITALYLLLSAPFLATMLLNYAGGENYTLFGLTIQFYRDSIRASEIVLLRPDWYAGFAANAQYLVQVLLTQTDGYVYMDLPRYGAHYLFALPLMVVGMACYIGDRIHKKAAWLGEGEAAGHSSLQAKWGMLLTVFWLLAAVWACLVTDGVHYGRAAILLYPVVFMTAYAVWRIAKRGRLLALLLAACYLVGAAGFGTNYFSGKTQHDLGRYYYAGLVDAMQAARGRAMDTLYVTQSLPEENQYGIPEEVLLQYALQLDPLYVRGQKQVTDAHGRVWASFEDRYQLVDMTTFYIDPQEEALYIVYDMDINDFNPADFTVESYGDYYLVTPNALLGA